MSQQQQHWLAVSLTDEEVLEKARSLAHLQQELEAVEQEKKAEAQKFKDRIENIEGTIASRAKEIRDGVEFRNVECELRFDWDTNTARTVRLDTMEVINERAITAAERQMGFDADEEGEAVDAEEEEQKATDPEAFCDHGYMGGVGCGECSTTH